MLPSGSQAENVKIVDVSIHPLDDNNMRIIFSHENQPTAEFNLIYRPENLANQEQSLITHTLDVIQKSIEAGEVYSDAYHHFDVENWQNWKKFVAQPTHDPIVAKLTGMGWGIEMGLAGAAVLNSERPEQELPYQLTRIAANAFMTAASRAFLVGSVVQPEILPISIPLMALLASYGTDHVVEFAWRFMDPARELPKHQQAISIAMAFAEKEKNLPFSQLESSPAIID